MGGDHSQTRYRLKQLSNQQALCNSVRDDLAEQQQVNAKLLSANNDLHADCTVAQEENCMLTARIGTLTELCHDTDTRVTTTLATQADLGALDDRLLLMESHVATQFTIEAISDTMSNLLATLTEAASTRQEDTDAIASMALETSRNLTLVTTKARLQVSHITAGQWYVSIHVTTYYQ